MRRLLLAALLVALAWGTTTLAQHRAPERVLDGTESVGQHEMLTEGSTAPLATLHPSRSARDGSLVEVMLDAPPKHDTVSDLV